MKKIFFGSILITSLFLSFSSCVFAQERLPLVVYPAKQDIRIKAGTVTHAQIQFRNNSDTPVFGNVKVVDFVINDKDGTPQLIENNEAFTKYGAAAWIQSEYSEITIPPNDFISINLTINPPKSITTCGNYAMVYFAPNLNLNKSKNDAGGSAITAKIGGLLNLESNNNQCVENASITHVEYNNFQEYGPITVNYDIANAGNTHITPSGSIQLLNFLGEVVDQKNIKDDRVFPETIRTYRNELGHKWMVGRYKIALNSTYGKNKTLNSVIYLWVFPWRFAIVIMIALIILFLLLREMYKKLMAKENFLEKQLEQEKHEIELLKEKLNNKRE
jgi:hypothetical protein